MTEELDIRNMKLHEEAQMGRWMILRVPGGWIYTYQSETGTGGWQTSSCFVPFSKHHD